MKCPCCEQESDKEFLFHDRKIYLRDGRSYYTQADVIRLMRKLLTFEPMSFANMHGHGLYVGISRLRDLIRDIGLPLRVVTDRTSRCYILKRVENVQNNDDAQCS